MAWQSSRPATIAAVLHNRVRLFREIVIPWQTMAAVAWLLCGVVGAPGPCRLFSDWTIIPLLVAVISARCSGMCWNRLIDCQIDACNPRTMHRVLPSGRMSPQEVACDALVTLALFLFSCVLLPPLGQWMGFVVSISLVLYSFSKRYTVLCHFFLGVIYGCLPVAGALWQGGDIPASVWLLSAAAFASVTGTDILYALQDEHFDRRVGLFRLPARCGRARALDIAATLHTGALVACTFALFRPHICLGAATVWAVAVVTILWAWRSLWSENSLISKVFALFWSAFPLGSLLSLVVDRVM